MPLLEVIQTCHLSVSIRLTDTTAAQVSQYATLIHASVDEVVEQALAYAFSKDRDFREFLKLSDAEDHPGIARASSSALESAEQPPGNLQMALPAAALWRDLWRGSRA